MLKRIISLILSLAAPLAAAPTGWAIYAGITGQEPFPMNPIIATIGAISIIVVSMGATLLMSDAYYFRQTSRNNKFERGLLQPLWWGGTILVVTVLSEIMLTLFVRWFTYYTVLVFPIMTLAGAFAVAGRIDLDYRNKVREEKREEEEVKKADEDAKAEAKREEKRARAREAYAKRQERKREQEAELLKAKKKREQAKIKEKEELTCKFCKAEGIVYVADNKRKLAGHIGGKHGGKKNGE